MSSIYSVCVVCSVVYNVVDHTVNFTLHGVHDITIICTIRCSIFGIVCGSGSGMFAIVNR